MEQFEKVCNGLDTEIEHLKHKSDTATALNMSSVASSYEKQVVICRDALALIRQQQERIAELEAAQMARVMSLEELENALDTVVWVEEPEFENFADHYALIMAYSHKVGFVRVSFGFAEMPVDCEYEYEDYGKK